jgi:phosphopantetheine adenylyltransferase
MKRNTDSQFFSNLTGYLELRISLQKDSLVSTVDMEEMKRIQGRVLELQEFLKALTRKPVAVQEHTGAFG